MRSNFFKKNTISNSPVRLEKVTLSLVTFLFVLLLTQGCGNEKKVTFKSSGMTHTFSEGGEDIPAELKLFVYPDGVVAGATNAHDNDGEQARFLTMSTTDSIEKVTGWYQNTMSKDGWTVDSTEKSTRMINMSGHKDDLEVNVLMAEDGKKTTISVSQGRAVDEPLDEREIDNFNPNELTPPTD